MPDNWRRASSVRHDLGFATSTTLFTSTGRARWYGITISASRHAGTETAGQLIPAWVCYWCPAKQAHSDSILAGTRKAAHALCRTRTQRAQLHHPHANKRQGRSHASFSPLTFWNKVATAPPPPPRAGPPAPPTLPSHPPFSTYTPTFATFLPHLLTSTLYTVNIHGRCLFDCLLSAL